MDLISFGKTPFLPNTMAPIFATSVGNFVRSGATFGVALAKLRRDVLCPERLQVLDQPPDEAVVAVLDGEDHGLAHQLSIFHRKTQCDAAADAELVHLPSESLHTIVV
jgi:hypothetical protein